MAACKAFLSIDPSSESGVPTVNKITSELLIEEISVVPINLFA